MLLILLPCCCSLEHPDHGGRGDDDRRDDGYEMARIEALYIEFTTKGNIEIRRRDDTAHPL